MRKIPLKYFLIIFLIIVLVCLALPYFSTVSVLTSGINAKKYGEHCEYSGECGNIVAINCGAEVDGPFYYISKSNGDILEYCGGYCDVPNGKYCQHCPPKEWNCK